jgi:hypothetical protein
MSDDNIITTFTVPDITHRPVFHLEHDVSETVFSLRFHMEPIQLGPIDRAILVALGISDMRLLPRNVVC